MSQLSLNNVINISVSATPAGLSAFNTSNLALFSSETPTGSWPSAGYKIYLDPTSVGADFGTTSITYLMALAVFSQTPNILAGGGSLVVITLNASEKIDAAIPRTIGLVPYFGVMTTTILVQADLLAAAAVIQANQLIGFFPADTAADIAAGGKLDLLRSGNFTQSRGLYYGDTTGSPAGINAIRFAAAYAGRALSTNFAGSNTAQTMNLKDLAGIQPDPTMTQTIQTAATAAGADTYVNLAGVSKVLCAGANQFFDEVYNLLWFVTALEVAGFNYLAQSSTKVPQTESGMIGLKSAYLAVCELSRSNGYAAAGLWTSPTTFGVQADMLANIAQRGYYIYSTPIAQQLPSARTARQAPLVQIALKEAGAMHSSSVIVNVNA